MRLSAHDASFLYTETASGPMHAVGLTLLDGAATFEELYKYYEARIHLIPRLRQRLALVPMNLAHPKWVDDPDFDLANHLKPYQLPKNCDLRKATEVALELGESLLDRSKPLWLTYVLETVDGKTLLAQMSHHAFVDGATAVAMSLVLTDPEPDAPPPTPPAQSWQPKPPPGAFELWQEAVQENAQQGIEDARDAVERAGKLTALNQQATSLMTRMARPVMHAPWNANLVGPKRQVTVREHQLSEFKPIRQALGGTINDIVVTVVAEGAARYLESKGEVLADQHLRLMCPVNVRAEGDDPLDMGGNRVSGMFPVLPAWSMPIAERFSTTRQELADIKDNNEPQVMEQLQHLQPSVPPIAMAQSLAVGTAWDPTLAAARAPLPVLPHTGGPRPQHTGFNFTCTNVLGPAQKQFIAGHEVLSATGTLMLSGNLGLGVSVGSYCGLFTFGFTADPRLLPDIENFAEGVESAFADLSALADQTEKQGATGIYHG